MEVESIPELRRSKYVHVVKSAARLLGRSESDVPRGLRVVIGYCLQQGSDESLAHPAPYIAAAVGLMCSQLVGTPNPAFETMLRRDYGHEIDTIMEALIPAVEKGLAGPVR